jgi:glucose uptake protein GlcU
MNSRHPEVTSGLRNWFFSFTGALAWAMGRAFSSKASRNLTRSETRPPSTTR